MAICAPAAPASALLLLALLSSAPPVDGATADGVHAVRDGVLSGSGGDGDGSQTGYYGGKCRDCNAHSSVSIDGKVAVPSRSASNLRVQAKCSSRGTKFGCGVPADRPVNFHALGVTIFSVLNHAGGNGCSKLTSIGKRPPSTLAVIEKGGCSFVQKAQNAAKAGYKGVIVLDGNAYDAQVKATSGVAGTGNETVAAWRQVDNNKDDSAELKIPLLLMDEYDFPEEMRAQIIGHAGSRTKGQKLAVNIRVYLNAAKVEGAIVKDAPMLFTEARRMFRVGRYSEAAARLYIATQMEPHFYPARYLLASAQFMRDCSDAGCAHDRFNFDPAALDASRRSDIEAQVYSLVRDVPPPPPDTFYDNDAQAKAREKALAIASAGVGPFHTCATSAEGQQQRRRKGGKLRVVMIGSSPSKGPTNRKGDAARAKHRAQRMTSLKASVKAATNGAGSLVVLPMPLANGGTGDKLAYLATLQRYLLKLEMKAKKEVQARRRARRKEQKRMKAKEAGEVGDAKNESDDDDDDEDDDEDEDEEDEDEDHACSAEEEEHKEYILFIGSGAAAPDALLQAQTPNADVRLYHQHQQSILETFHSFCADIVFGALRKCHPNPALALAYEGYFMNAGANQTSTDATPKNANARVFLDAEHLMGERTALLDALSIVVDEVERRASYVHDASHGLSIGTRSATLAAHLAASGSADAEGNIDGDAEIGTVGATGAVSTEEGAMQFGPAGEAIDVGEWITTTLLMRVHPPQFASGVHVHPVWAEGEAARSESGGKSKDKKRKKNQKNKKNKKNKGRPDSEQKHAELVQAKLQRLRDGGVVIDTRGALFLSVDEEEREKGQPPAFSVDATTKRLLFTPVDVSSGELLSPNVLYRSGPDPERIFPKVVRMAKSTGSLARQDTM